MKQELYDYKMMHNYDKYQWSDSSDENLLEKNTNLLNFMTENQQTLSVISDFKYDNIPYNRKALFRIPSFDFLTMVLKEPPSEYSSIINICNSTGPVFVIDQLKNPEFDSKSVQETIEDKTYKIGCHNMSLLYKHGEKSFVEGDRSMSSLNGESI